MKEQVNRMLNREEEFDKIVEDIFVVADKEKDKTKRKEKMLELVGQIKRAYLGAHYDAITDSLTGCFNKKHIKEIYHHQYAGAKRNKQYFSLGILDIDYLKYTNDNFGHAKGDDLIKKIAAEITKAIRESDLVFRYGGDEFVIFCSHNNNTGMKSITNRIKKEVQSLKVSKGFVPSVSVGYITVRPETCGNLAYAKLFEEADAMLYAEKRKRKPAKFIKDTKR